MRTAEPWAELGNHGSQILAQISAEVVTGQGLSCKGGQQALGNGIVQPRESDTDQPQ